MRIDGLLFLALPLIACDAAAAVGTARPGGDVYIEFLWDKTPKDAIARQETRSFALDGRFDHQVCVAITKADARARGLVLHAVDASGKMVSRQTHDDFDGKKACYSADLPATAAPGKWTYEVYLDGDDVAAGERPIDVFPTVDALISHTPSGMPYVLGRPNYDPSIPPEDFHGELSWIMHIRRSGTVSQVDIEHAVGIGEIMRDRALAAGYLSLFPPDADRGADATFRRRMSFRPDE